MTLHDLKPGYVVQVRNGRMYMLTYVDTGSRLTGLFVNPDKGYNLMSDYKEDLTVDRPGRSPYDIMAVYGYPDKYEKALDISTATRTCIWKREAPKKMTVAQICEALGYEVEIVRDADA